jgi:hypothetical protein
MTNKDFRKIIAQDLNALRHARNFWVKRTKNAGLNPWDLYEDYTCRMFVLRKLGWKIPREKI